MRRLLLAGVTLALAACVTPGSKLVEASKSALVAPAGPVLYQLSALSYSETSLGQRIEIVLDHASQIFDDGQTRRYVRGFTLPRTDRPYAISLSSYLQGTPGDPAILYPELLVLDAAYRPLSKTGPDKFSYRKGSSNDALHGVVFINDNSKGERHLLVTSRPLADAELTDTALHTMYSIPVSVPVKGGMLTWMIPQGHSEKPTKMIASPSGKLEISFEEYRLRKVGEQD
ncbi:MAG: hypothetical protein HZC24_05155 [Rhodocyclales bacterium]|nr:hypothetical protein [Rhodocyclales bacterium]